MFTLKNNFYESNTYIIPINSLEVILIDAGDPDIYHITSWLKQHNKSIRSVILTHEHADHCAGINLLFAIKPFSLFCSAVCAKNITNCKRNFSYYLENIDSFEVNVPTIPINDGKTIEFDGQIFTFFETPGHSPGSICIFNENTVFTGDTILNGIKAPVYLPNSNKLAYVASIEKLRHLIKPGMTIYPGHGESFTFFSMDQINR